MSLYDVLWLSPSASEAEIKQNYKKLATAFHPDKHTQGEAQEISSRGFRNLEAAYRILSNKVTRGIYDTYGHEGLKTYETNKKYFEDIDKDAEDTRMRAIKRYKTVKLMDENSKVFDEISAQRAIICYNMASYLTRVSAGLAHKTLPYGRIQSVHYSAAVNISKGYTAGLQIDTENESTVPHLYLSTSVAVYLFTRNIFFTLNKDLMNLGSGELEISKFNIGKL